MPLPQVYVGYAHEIAYTVGQSALFRQRYSPGGWWITFH